MEHNGKNPVSLQGRVIVDPDRDEVEIYGVRYSGEFFRSFGLRQVREGPMVVLHREDGVVTVHYFSECPHCNQPIGAQSLGYPSQASTPKTP